MSFINELVDIINDEDKVVAVVPRNVMREKQLPHRASYVLVVDRASRILVEVRTLCKDYEPGKLDACVGGVMQSGEDPIVSAKREVEEEIGLDMSDVDFHNLGKLLVNYKNCDSFLMAYLFIAVGDFITSRQKSEVSSIMMLSYDEIMRLEDNFTYDSIIALKEIVHRAAEQDICYFI